MNTLPVGSGVRAKGVLRDGMLSIGHIRLPERHTVLRFGDAVRQRRFTARSHSLYVPFVNTQGTA
jgi:hypothetical protein